MYKFAKIMASPFGRIIRVVAGLGLIAWGFLSFSGTETYLVAGIGILPILTGLMNICVVGPILGAPLKGSNT